MLGKGKAVPVLT